MKKLLGYLKEKRTVTTLLVVCFAIVFYMLLGHLSDVGRAINGVFTVISPLIGGAVIAYLLDPFARLMERTIFRGIKLRRAARSLSVVCCFVLVLAIVVVLIVTMIPQLAESVGILVDNLRYYFQNSEQTVDALVERFPQLDLTAEAVMSKVSEWVDTLTKLLTNNIAAILKTGVDVGSGVVNFALELILSLYILFDKNNILRSIRRWGRSRMTLEEYDKTHAVLVRGNNIFTGYLGSNILDSLIIGVVNFIVMAILGMPYALLISVIVGVTNFIPTFGPIIGAVPSAFILVLIDPWDALWFLVLTVALQTVDAYIIKPLLFRDSTGLRPLWVMAAIIIGGRLFGVWGMIFGIPVLAVISQLLNESVDKRLESRGLDSEGAPLNPEPEKK